MRTVEGKKRDAIITRWFLKLFMVVQEDVTCS
jgi:hypothetical protein